MSRASSRAASLGLAIAVPLLLFAWIEGCASGLIALRAAFDQGDGPEIRRHDPLLGWVSLPDLAVPDLWGPGRDLHTNARGFRGRDPVTDAAPAGRRRVVCSGDSFAFGEGVGDTQTFCHRLGQLDPRIEPVNLGQAGYGVDQMYLRYREQARDLEVHHHLFTFIGPDLSRAGSRDFHGFAKPVFRLDGDALVLDGVPVPETLPAARRAIAQLGATLRITEFVRRGRKKLFGKPERSEDRIFEALGPVLERVFDEVARTTREGGAEVLFAYLPLRSEIDGDGRWRGWVAESFARSGLPLVDLTDALRAEPRDAADDYFICEGLPAAGHYSPEGNAWAAQQLLRALRRPSEGVVGSR